MFDRKLKRGGKGWLRAAASVAAAAAFGLVSAAHIRAQSAAAAWETAAGGKQEFEVASVRKDKAAGRSYSNFSLDNGNAYFTVTKEDRLAPKGTLFMAQNQPLLRYIIFAYKLGGTEELALRFDYFQGLALHTPDWVRRDGFDIEARAPGEATKDQMRLMMQSLLAERFKLAVHTEMRNVPVFAMVLAKPGKVGPQLWRHSASDNCATTAFREDPGKDASAAVSAIPIPCGEIAHLPTGALEYRFGGRNVTLAMLAESLPAQTGMATTPRPVIDETGLTGRFDFSLEWTHEDSSTNYGETGGTFRDALKKQLGLKLEPRKSPVEVLVIDHVEQPSPN